MEDRAKKETKKLDASTNAATASLTAGKASSFCHRTTKKASGREGGAKKYQPALEKKRSLNLTYYEDRTTLLHLPLDSSLPTKEAPPSFSASGSRQRPSEHSHTEELEKSS